MKRVFGAITDNIRSTQDGTLKITLALQENPKEVAGDLFTTQGKYVKVLITDNNITELEETHVESLKLTAQGKKNSNSQRLRAVLFRRWEQNNNGHQKFETYYDYEMESIISKQKDFLQS